MEQSINQPFIERCKGNPEGALKRHKGWIVFDEDSGNMYQKTTIETENTGWVSRSWNSDTQDPGVLTGFYFKPTVADMRQIVTRSSNAVCFTEGNLTADDGGGYPYFWKPNSEYEDDGSTIIKPDDVAADEAGRWEIAPWIVLGD